MIEPHSYPMITLVDSGSSHSFIDEGFIRKHNLHTGNCSPLHLRLFDRSYARDITKKCKISILFPGGEQDLMDLHVTSLDPSVSAVLGHDWLTHYNPTINWVLGIITFKNSNTGQDLWESQSQRNPLVANYNYITPMDNPGIAFPEPSC